ncbi:pentapeptide repeat-containing protein [Synechococcus sp. GEYO]|uniref:pentapeptide repeat-containing protein n=1 Tax=Synechococcus sp. GEYO TaxID=2575511 RepID=UPI000E0E465B|nr:pentapeptide repeat-containing protein [Synechococcus sp. GEYO]
MTKSKLAILLLLISGNLIATPLQANEALFRLLQERSCNGCKLADTDLVHADLRDADLNKAQLQRANLSRANMDGANLSGADLSFTSLKGASLRGANLKGAKLYGTDFRESDLTGAQLDINALEEAHWRGAKGITSQVQSHAALHNAGVSAAKGESWRQAEDLFSKAIKKKPDIAESWVARAITREKLGKRKLAIKDFNYASELFEAQGMILPAQQLEAAAIALQDKENKNETGNGAGSALLSGLISTSKALIPIAMKLFMPALGLSF